MIAIRPLKAAAACAVDNPPRVEDRKRQLADPDRAEPGAGVGEDRRDGPRVARQQLPVGAREGAQVLGQRVVALRACGSKRPKDPVEQRRHEWLLGREVVVERHRHRLQVRGDGAHAERLEAVGCGDRLGRLENAVGGPVSPAGGASSARRTPYTNGVAERSRSNRVLDSLVWGAVLGAASGGPPPR